MRLGIRPTPLDLLVVLVILLFFPTQLHPFPFMRVRYWHIPSSSPLFLGQTEIERQPKRIVCPIGSIRTWSGCRGTRNGIDLHEGL
jgi:hypothetical protein